MNNCPYCGGNCPNEPEDSEFLCDGFAGDIDDLCNDQLLALAEAKTLPEEWREVDEDCPFVTLHNKGGLITCRDSEYEVTLGYLTEQNGEVFEKNLGKVDVTPEQAKIHNSLLKND